MRSALFGGGRHTATPAGDLRAAARSGHLVSVACTPKGLAPVEGLVVLVGLRWAVVRRLHPDLVLDGYVAVPTLQVSRVVDLTFRDWRAAEVARLVDDEGAAVPHVDPTTTTTLLRSASAEFGVLTIATARRGAAARTGEVERMVGRQVVFTPLRGGSGVEPCPLELLALHEVVRVGFDTRVTSAWARARGHRRTTELAAAGFAPVPGRSPRPSRRPAVA